MKPKGTVRFTVSLPEDLLAEMDSMMTDHAQGSRSEFVRDLIRSRLVAARWQEGSVEVVGVLTISYDHHQRGLQERINHVQHHSYVNVLCSTHVHLDHDHCMETIIIRGKPTEIEKLARGIGALRGVRFAELVRASKVPV